MAEITAAQVKELRERTGAGMMDCKSALVEAKGDFEEAVKVLRKKGLAAAGSVRIANAAKAAPTAIVRPPTTPAITVTVNRGSSKT